MPVKVPLHGVTVQRKDDEGSLRNVHPPVGKPFDFTDKEIATLSRSGMQTLRDPPRGEPVVKADYLMQDVHASDPPATATDDKPSVKKPVLGKKLTGKPEDEDDGL